MINSCDQDCSLFLSPAYRELRSTCNTFKVNDLSARTTFIELHKQTKQTIICERTNVLLSSALLLTSYPHTLFLMLKLFFYHLYPTTELLMKLRDVGICLLD